MPNKKKTIRKLDYEPTTDREEVIELINGILDVEIKKFDDQERFMDGEKKLYHQIEYETIEYGRRKIEKIKTYIKENLK